MARHMHRPPVTHVVPARRHFAAQSARGCRWRSQPTDARGRVRARTSSAIVEALLSLRTVGVCPARSERSAALRRELSLLVTPSACRRGHHLVQIADEHCAVGWDQIRDERHVSRIVRQRRHAVPRTGAATWSQPRSAARMSIESRSKDVVRRYFSMRCPVDAVYTAAPRRRPMFSGA